MKTPELEMMLSIWCWNQGVNSISALIGSFSDRGANVFDGHTE